MLHAVLIAHGTHHDLGALPTDNPDPTTLANRGRVLALLRDHNRPIHPDDSLLLVRLGPNTRLWRVRSLLDMELPVNDIRYPQAGPAIRNALCLAADRCRCSGERRDRFDGLVLALEILLHSDDTAVAPGIAWRDVLPVGSLDHARWMLGANAYRLLDA